MTLLLKGNIIYTAVPEKFESYPRSYILVEDGKVKSVSKEIPEGYIEEQVEDLGEALIIPGFVDIHVHAPQWENAGIGYSKELIPWLNEYTFPMEGNFKDIEFAKEKYKVFVEDLRRVGTTRACVMASCHKEATEVLMDLFKKSGLGAYVGKVNMDRNTSSDLIEETEASVRETEELILNYRDKNKEEVYRLEKGLGNVEDKVDNKMEKQFEMKAKLSPLVNYIITPRFVPCTTAKLMTQLGKLAAQYDLPVQSHLDENRSEVAWVRELHPERESFTEVYAHYGLLRQGKTIMAHCIYNTPEEVELLKKYDVMVAHCAQSNFNLASGIMPLRHYLKKGIKVGLGSDVGAGHTLDMRAHIVATVMASKMHWVSHPEDLPLSISEAYYLATKGGGQFFGKVGSFEEGYEFDALVVEDTYLRKDRALSLEERLEKFIYTGSKEQIKRCYVRGKSINMDAL